MFLKSVSRGVVFATVVATLLVVAGSTMASAKTTVCYLEPNHGRVCQKV